MINLNFKKMVKKNEENFNLKLDKKTQVYICLGLLIISSLIVNYAYTRNLQSLPSPMYGGDYYFQLGAVNHVKYGGNPLDSSSSLGELPSYFPLYSFIVGNFARLLNINAITAIFITSYIFTSLAVILLFLVSYNLFKNIYISFIGAFYSLFLMPFPICKYSDFGIWVIIPLFIYLLYTYLKEQSLKNAIFVGLVYGLTGISHGIEFIASSLLLFFFFIKYFIINNFKSKNLKFDKLKRPFLNYIIIAILGIGIAMLYWYQPIFTFHGKTEGLDAVYNLSKFSTQFMFLFNFVKYNFLSFNTIPIIIFSLFNIIALIGLFIIKSEDESISFIKFIFISFIIISFHYFLTQNILNFNLVPGQLLAHLSSIMVLFFIFGLYTFSLIFKKLKISELYPFFIILVLFILSLFLNYNIRVSDRWYNAGLSPVPAYMNDLTNFLVKDGSVNDVVLTTKEVGFAVNAISGRKLISFRRGHGTPFPFISFDTREIDTALILYGNNTDLKKQLLKEYNIKYLYWDYYWIQSEYIFDNNGNLVNKYDPLFLFYNETKIKILDDNNVKHFTEVTWQDPSMRDESFPKYKLEYISYLNYNTATHPWNTNLDQFLEEVWSYDMNGQKIAVLYKVKNI